MSLPAAAISLEDWIRQAAQRLRQSLPDASAPVLEARMLAEAALGVSRAFVFAHGREPIAAEGIAALEAWLQRRLAGEPMAYILGEREFYGRRFQVSPATLIPRPETEHLIEAALQRGPQGPARVLDIGAGSGCVAITLKLERPHWQVTGIDVSAKALAIARANATALGAAVDWRESDLFARLGGERFDLIVGNPPYVAAGDPHLDQGDVRFEPHLALVSGVDGLDLIRRIVRAAPAHLAAGGWLILEHGWDQAEAVKNMFAAAGFSDLFLLRDLAGQARIRGGRR